MRRPDLGEHVERVALLRKQLVRVIDDDGRAVGPWNPELPTEETLAGLREMMLVRAFDARLLRAHRQARSRSTCSASGKRRSPAGTLEHFEPAT